MATKYFKLKDWIKEYESGSFFKASYFDGAVLAGWYDWFCSDKDCITKLKAIYNLVKSIDNPDLLEMQISFKNVCPFEGPLYDYIYLENEDTGVSLIIQHRNRKWSIYEEYDSYGHFIPRDFNKKKDLFNFLNDFNKSSYKLNYEKDLEERNQLIDDLYKDQLAEERKSIVNIIKTDPEKAIKLMDDITNKYRDLCDAIHLRG